MASQAGVFSVRLPADRQKELDTLGKVLERPRSWLLNKAIEEFLEVHRWQISEIKKSLKEADAGDFATEKEIRALNQKYSKHAR